MADISFSERAWEEFQYWMGQDKDSKADNRTVKGYKQKSLRGDWKAGTVSRRKREMEQTHKRSRPFGIFRG